jgi:hypothetical protein
MRMGLHRNERGFRTWRRLGSLTTALVLAAGSVLVVDGAAAQMAPRAEDPRTGIVGYGVGAPEVDARLNHDGLAGEEALASLALWRGSPKLAARFEAMTLLRKHVPTARIDDNQIFGTPQFVRSTEEFLTPARPGVDAIDVVAEFVQDYAAMFESDAGEVRKARVSRDFRTDHNGVRHLSFQQQHDGVDLFKIEMTANVTADGRLINVGGGFVPRPAGGFTPPAPAISAAEAIVLAARSVGSPIAAAPEAIEPEAGASRRQVWGKVPGLREEEPVVTQFVYFARTRENIRPAWTVVIPQRGVGHTYDCVIDAVTGEVLFRTNRLCYATTQPITFRVYTSDGPQPASPGTATPDGTQFPFVSRSLVTVTPAQMATHSPNGWIDDGGTETLGNNCDGHLDRDATANSPDLPRPNGGAGRVFDFAQDNAQAPLTYSDAAVTQLFYWGNVYHDRLMALGFNEAAGNFQQINFSGLGVGNDRVQLDSQDGSGTNNANFSTPADGSSGRCQMYIFTGPTPDRDGSLDGDIVFHELTHGTSNRLHTPGNLPAPQGGGMGEGWSDFYGMLLNAEAGDDPHAVYPTGAYATYQFSTLGGQNSYFGIRRFPYSTDLTKNPLTFADIATALISYPPGVPQSPIIPNTATEVHNVGEAWCMALMECRAALHGVHGSAANNLLLQLVTDGMKLDPRPPNFLQARDAIIQADLTNNAGANASLLWAAFAKRGMGAVATSPAPTSTVGIVEDLGITLSHGVSTPIQLQPGVPTTFSVTLTPTHSSITVTPGTERLFYSVNGGAFLETTLTPTSPGVYNATIPAASCGDAVRYYVQASTNNSVSRRFPHFAPLEFYTAEVYTSQATSFSDDFETNQGWTATITQYPGTTAAMTGLWERADPNAITTIQPGDDHTSAPGVFCFVTQNGAAGAAAGTNDVDNATTVLTSPVFSMAGQTDALFSYWIWFSNGGSTDVLTVEVSSDAGGSWLPAQTIGPTSNNTGGWVSHSVAASSVAGLTLTATMQIRFSVADAPAGSVVEAAVDDVVVFSRTCVATPGCPADVDDGSGTGTPDGGVTIDDLIYYLSLFEAGNVDADVDDGSGTGTPDGGVTIDDLIFYLTHFEGGC